MASRQISAVVVALVTLALVPGSYAEGRPNIVFLLADDLGYTDIEPYGSEVSTPALSRLAREGVRFTNYHTAANCAPARAMLLTGVNNHLAGVPNIPEMLAPEQRTQANYQGVLGDNVVTIATLLEGAGYHTYMAGKWHLGADPGKLPSQRGFERTVALMDSGADNWEQRPYLPIYERAASLGIVPEAAPMTRMPTTTDWNALRPDRQRYEAKRMAVYAGMIEAMDANIARLVAYLEDQGQLDDTIFIFTSDNGAEGSGVQDPTSFPGNLLPSSLGYRTDYETLGLKGSYNSINPGFTSAAVSPLAFYKFYVGEGGLRVPLIISGRSVPASPAPTGAFAWATDVAATILAFAGVAAPDGRYAGKPVLPVTGKDLVPLLRGEAERVYGENDAVGYELTGHAALFQGDLKIVRNLPPLGDGEWRLYDIVEDPGETRDLKAELPDRFQAMLTAYARFEKENQVMPIPAGYSQTGQLLINLLRDRFGSAILVALLTVLLLVPFVVYVRTRRRYEKT